MNSPSLGRLAAAAAVAALLAASPANAAIVPKDSADEVAQAIIADQSTLNLATTDWQDRPVETDPVTGLPTPAVDQRDRR